MTMVYGGGIRVRYQKDSGQLLLARSLPLSGGDMLVSAWSSGRGSAPARGMSAVGVGRRSCMSRLGLVPARHWPPL